MRFISWHLTQLIAGILTIPLLIPSVLGHGMVTIPQPRSLGPAAQAACGAAAYKVLNSDQLGPIENAATKAATDSSYNAQACHLYFCKGYQFEDNKTNVYTYKPGEEITFHVKIEARHTGYANVSIVDLTSQTTLGTPLYNWPVYTNNSLGPPDWPKNETDFSITLPSSLGTKCQQPGKCAIQWYWYAYSNKQTYESCVDFVTV